MPNLTPAERSLRARLAAYTLHSRVDGREHTEPARKAFLGRFALQVDPEGRLAPAERQRRAQAPLGGEDLFADLDRKGMEPPRPLCQVRGCPNPPEAGRSECAKHRKQRQRAPKTG